MFSDESRVQYYLDIEAALARVQARLGIIPAACRRGNLPPLRCRRRSTWRCSRARPSASAIPCCRWCSSSSGYVGTGWASGAIGAPRPRTSPIRRPSCRSATRWCWSSRICTRSPSRLRASRAKYRDTPMAGRSNLQQAVPITFGYKMAVLLAGFRAAFARLARAAAARAGRRVRRRRRHARLARRARA